MEICGKIIEIMEAKRGTSLKTGNSWVSQEYVIEISGLYPRHCVFSVFGDERIKQLCIQKDEELTVQFDVDAREHNGRWYNDFKAYNVIRNQRNQISQRTNSLDQSSVSKSDSFPFADNEGDNEILPF